MKKLTSIILVLAMVLTLMCGAFVSAYADDEAPAQEGELTTDSAPPAKPSGDSSGTTEGDSGKQDPPAKPEDSSDTTEGDSDQQDPPAKPEDSSDTTSGDNAGQQDPPSGGGGGSSDLSYTQGSSAEVKVKTSGSKGKTNIASITIDGNEIALTDADKSTDSIALDPAVLDALSVGEHTVVVTGENGKTKEWRRSRPTTRPTTRPTIPPAPTSRARVPAATLPLPAA